ncbi:MAG: DUF2497 domain-containing protein [Methyloligellaceae bacterium]
MSSSEQSPEPTMDEILASIRRIIADEPTVLSDRPPEPAGDNMEIPEEGVVNDIARARSQVGGEAVPNGAAGDDILELTNEVAAASAPSPEALPAEPSLAAGEFPAAPEQAAHVHPFPEPASAEHERPPVAFAPGHELHPNMGPSDTPFPPAEAAAALPIPQLGDSMPPDIGQEAAFRPEPGQRPMGGPPPQAFVDAMRHGAGPLNAEAGDMVPRPPVAAPSGYGGPEAVARPGSPERSEPGAFGAVPAPEGSPGAMAPEMPLASAPQPQGHEPEIGMDHDAGPVDPHVPVPASEPAPGLVTRVEDLQPEGDAQIEVDRSVSDWPETSDAEPIVSEPEPVEAAPADVADGAPESEAPEMVATRGGEAEKTEPENSFETGVKEMLKPMLRDWLDDNLPRLLEGAMKDEMESRTGKKNKE